MNRNFIENYYEFKIMNIFSTLSQNPNIDILDEKDKTYLVESNKRLLNYIDDKHVKKEDINFDTIEPIDYIEIISNYYKKYKKEDTDLLTLVKGTIINFKENRVSEISDLLKYYEYQLNSSLSLW